METNDQAGLTWGEQLRSFRNRLGLTQGQLIETLANLSIHVSMADEAEWHTLGIYEEVINYLGEILDVSTLSRLEQGKRALNPRARHIALVWALRRLGAMINSAEANQWLALGDQGHLTETELTTIFDQAAEQSGSSVPEEVPITTIPPLAEQTALARPEQRVLAAPSPSLGRIPLSRWPLLVVAALLIGLLFFFSIRLLRPVRPATVLTAPTIWETFAGNQLDQELWQPNVGDWHGSVKDGVLSIDVSLNHGAAVEEELNYLGAIGQIERIQWRTIVDVPTNYPSGYLGVQTGCFDDQGWLKLLVGGSPPHLRLVYDTDDEPGGVVDTPLLDLEPAQLYDITVDWHPYKLDVVVNRQALPTVATACNWTTFFNLSANIEQGQMLRGQVDDIGVWYTEPVDE